MVKERTRVLIAMSGGVDSSVAAALLKEQGFQVSGITMRIWDGKEPSQQIDHHGCYGPGEEEDIEDARKVALHLGIPFHVFDLTQEYQSVVLDYFCQEYLRGRTPNPCVRCNQRIKFNALIEKASQFGLAFDYIASGHYARIDHDFSSGRYLLKKARDLTKDQSYFLCFLSQSQLSSLMFPLGNMAKVEVRQIAVKLGLQVAHKPDSQNFVCGDYSSVFTAPSTPGPIVDHDGKTLGQHRGLQHYTIGQRKGLQVSGGQPLYVTAIDPARNTVIMGERNALLSHEFTVSGLNWISIQTLNEPTWFKARIRSSQKEAEALVTPEMFSSAEESTSTSPDLKSQILPGTSSASIKVRVRFKQPQMAIAPGQVVVFYRDDVVVGGGIID